MQVKKIPILILAVFIVVTNVSGDTYGTFKTTRYYSVNRQYFVEVTEKRRATLYRVDSPRPRRQWTRTLPELPGQLLVTNDGRRVAIIDRYYGNGGDPNMAAVILLDEKGHELTRYRLADVANLDKVLATTSAAHWYSMVAFTPDQSQLIVDTIVAKRDRSLCGRVNSAAEAEECSKAIPYEQLRFSTANGKLISRTNVTAIVR